MWSPDRRTLLSAGGAAALLAGCGWRPALREGGPGATLRGRVRLSAPPGRLGFALRDAVETRLGVARGGADHLLEADVAIAESGVAITEATAITRFVVRGESRWRLTGPLAGPEGLTGEARSTAGYSATESLFATRAARRDAERQVARDLGQRMATEILARVAAPGAAG